MSPDWNFFCSFGFEFNRSAHFKARVFIKMALSIPRCSQVERDYDTTDRLGKGTFGEVHKAVHKSTGTVVALKMIFLHNEKEGFPVTALREIEILQCLDHPNVVPLLEMSVNRGNRALRKRFGAYMVMPYMEHDLAGLLDNPFVKLSLAQMKFYMRQILEGVNYIHQKLFLHRDIKAANLLIDNKGCVKIADFGLARRYFDAPPTVLGSGERHSSRRYTSMVVTRWYRAPELILGDSHYTTAIDMWGVGCIFGEMFRHKPILQGKSDIDQGHRIFSLIGPPNEYSMPGCTNLSGFNEKDYAGCSRTLEKEFNDLPDEALSLLSGMLTLDPLARFSALGALDHAFFHTDPPEASPEDLPIYADSHEMDAKGRNNRPDPVTAIQNSHVGNVSSRTHTPGVSGEYDSWRAAGLPPKPNFHGQSHYNDSRRGHSKGPRNYHSGNKVPPYRKRDTQPHYRRNDRNSTMPPYRREDKSHQGLDY